MRLLRFCLVPFALLCVILLRLLRGRVRIGILQGNRIGHLAGNVEVHLCERDAGIRPRNIEIWCSPWGCCNDYLMKMWRRVITIDRTGFVTIVQKVDQLFKGWQKVEIESGNLDRDAHNLYEKYPPHLRFTAEEEARGKRELIRMGIPPNAKWVCLIVRDGTYLPHLAYHGHRDSDIDSYALAALMLARRGYYVIRMGAKVSKPMPFATSRIIDYATNGMRSEFMDIYLCAKCVFALNNGAGLDAVCCAFRRPSVYVNFVPIEYLATWSVGSLAIWKHHEKDGKRMTPAEIWASGAGGFMRTAEYEEAGITLVNNTPEEILAAAEEMADGLSLEDQSAFWRTFPRSISPYTRTPLHGEIRMRIGREFLKDYAAPQMAQPARAADETPNFTRTSADAAP